MSDLSPLTVERQVLKTLNHPLLNDRRATLLKPDASDAEAIAHWLEKAAGRGSLHTASAYRRELRRFLDWWQPIQKPLDALNLDQLSEYFNYLALPPESAGFGPQSPAKRNYTRTVLGSLFGHLQALGHIGGNPFILVSVLSEDERVHNAKTLKAKRGRMFVDPRQEGDPRAHWRPRYLSRDALRLLWHVIEQLPVSSDRQKRQSARTRWLFILLLLTGLRRHEVNRNGMNAFECQDGHWRLSLIGKGAKPRRVTCAPLLIRELRQYRIANGLPELPETDEDIPLVLSVQGQRIAASLDDSRINGILKALRERALDDVRRRQLPESLATEIAQLTPHRLRHSWATHRTQVAPQSLEVTQLEAGHANRSTTQIYAKLANAEHLAVAQALEESLFGPL
ncbi:MAG: tyrosine-type recombinase/integrase [Hahellaceae bacterium]|nr:tyrosine-type recombinase/integrase [Hahellaceae bacterium]